MPAWVRPAAGQALPLAADDAAPLGPLVGASGLGMLVGALLFSAFGPGLPRRATFAWGFLLGGSPLFLVPAQRPGLVPDPSPPVPGGLDPNWIRAAVARALDEDLGAEPGRDVTTQATVPADETGVAHLVARESGVVAGLVVVAEVLAQVAGRFALPAATVDLRVPDGAAVTAGDVLAVLAGPAQVLLMAERTLLNFTRRASGIATHTRRWADALAGSSAEVLDTRKTMLGLRALEKYAVRCGGGTNKRMGLYDAAMVKDNHVVAAGSVTAAVAAVSTHFPDVVVQVEADTLDQAIEAIAAGARFLLLDNMATPLLANVVGAVQAREGETGRVELEATGNLTLARSGEVASTGVDYLSVGALTHSSAILDLALDLISRT